MYNDFQKKRYLESENFRHEDSAKEVAERIFETVSETERQKDKDLSEFNKIQVIDLLKNINSKSKYYLRLVSKMCFEYTNWQKVQGAIDNGNINYYDYSIVKDIIDELIPLEMVEDKHFSSEYVIDLVTNKVKDPVNKLLVYAPYKGICNLNCEDLKYLKYSDINEEDKTVQLKSGLTVKVDDLFIQLAKEAESATEYMPDGVSELGNVRNDNLYLYDSCSYLIKSTGKNKANEPVNQSFIIRRFKFIQQQVDNNFITPSNLYKNGLINYIKERFAEQNVTLKQAFFERLDKRNYVHTVELKKYIEEYGSKISERQLRQELQEVISLYE
jgi:hypothetical protein